MKHTSSTICEMMDPKGNTFKVKHVKENKFLHSYSILQTSLQIKL